MKYTGVIRRLDNLGRLVIPREFRKLQNIKAGDPLEICVQEDGDMIVRRVDLGAKLVKAGSAIVSELFDTLQLAFFLCDTEKFLSGSSNTLNSIIGTLISGELSFSIQKNKEFVGKINIPYLEKDFYCCSYPVFVDDLFGALVVISTEQILDWKQKVTKMASRIIANNL